MSQETIQPSTVEQGGLTLERQQKAIDLREQHYGTDLKVREVEREQKQYIFNDDRGGERDPIGFAHDVIQHAVVQHKANKAKRAAIKHYRQHEGAYQEQALKEATEAGKDIQGWPQE